MLCSIKLNLNGFFTVVSIMPVENKTNSHNCEYTPAVERYVSSFDDIDKMCFEIAKSHLKSSFSIEKSVGFKKFNAKK